MNEALTKQFMREEVATLKRMALLKSPDPNGINPNFYQTYWHIMRDEITLVVLQFLNECIFDKCINFLYIDLIPKIKYPVSASDFRPITLYNVIYKLVYKFIANRLKQILLAIISKS